MNCYVWLSGLFSSKPISATAKRNFWLTAILVSAIGFSRLYLGVHWLTDVTAGYAIGLVWLIVCILSLQLSVAQTW
ncbi:hypothetical protein B7486_36560 [cyanobacterium TDX16]|nr:hypothetical protein B7486_36560 [cyanobacterium TDX16]